MKLEKKIDRLITEHSAETIATEIIRQIGVEKILLLLSNRLTYKAMDSRNKEQKTWRRRAKVVHDMMEEILKEKDVIITSVGDQKVGMETI